MREEGPAPAEAEQLARVLLSVCPSMTSIHLGVGVDAEHGLTALMKALQAGGSRLKVGACGKETWDGEAHGSLHEAVGWWGAEGGHGEPGGLKVGACMT